MDEKTKKQCKDEFLRRHIFSGLTNLNEDFIPPFDYHFSAPELETVLQRAKPFGLGIYSIDAWKDRRLYETITCAASGDMADPDWYFNAFQRLKAADESLQFAASCYVPEHLLPDGDVTKQNPEKRKDWLSGNRWQNTSPN